MARLEEDQAEAIARLASGGGLRTLYQPIVELATGRCVGLEALARGPAGSTLESPAALFAGAGRSGLEDRLGLACARAAVAGVADAGRPPPPLLFVNAEPATIARLPAQDLVALAHHAPPETQLVLEITERGTLVDPAGLLAGVDRARAAGWAIAIDDVGEERSALALLPFVRPDIIKLDLGVIQQRASLDTAEIVHAVAAYVERTGATLIAEGVETTEQRDRAAALGAVLVQGWLTGRPGAVTAVAFDGGPRPLRPRSLSARGDAATLTPFDAIAPELPVRRTTRALLGMISAQLERQALQLDDLTVVAAGFQHARHFQGKVLRRYEMLARSAALVTVVGARMPEEPAPGVRGVPVAPSHPQAAGWTVAVLGPHFAAVLAARETGLRAEDGAPLLDYVLSYDRERAATVAEMLLRCAPADAPARRDVPSPAVLAPPDRAGDVAAGALPDLLTRAIATAVNPITITDARVPDMPLVYVNDAFLRMTGYRADEVLGRNCRFLQGPDTDRAAVAPIGRMLAAGRPVQTVLLNYRRDGTPFYNELVLSPVHDDDGVITHHIGNQRDVTEHVRRERATSYLAYHDALVGLPNAVQLADHLELEVARARRTGTRLAVVHADIDGFSAVNTTAGHAAGDVVLREVAGRFRATTRTGDLVARHGDDEFAVVLCGLGHDAEAVGRRAAQALVDALHEALSDGRSVSASVGVAVMQHAGERPAALLARAAAASAEARAAGGGRVCGP